MAAGDTDQRYTGDRLYCVLDTDLSGLPHHADIVATIPRPHDMKKPKEAWRAERGRLMALLARERSTPLQFREGALSQVAPASSPQK